MTVNPTCSYRALSMANVVKAEADLEPELDGLRPESISIGPGEFRGIVAVRGSGGRSWTMVL